MKTIIVIDNLNIGGVASSLYNFLPHIIEKSECDLFVFNESSIDLNRIPPGVNVITPPKTLHILGKTQTEIKKESKIMALFRVMLFGLSKLINGETARSILFLMIRPFGEYDLAISYAQDDGWKSLSKGCNDFILKKITAKQKVCIIHCDYKNFGGYNNRQYNAFNKLDSIICLSESCKASFLECFPKLNDKAIVCENFTDIERIKRLAKNPIEYDSELINFVSVCRLSTVKGLDRCIFAIKELIDEGYSGFTLTIVGDGPEYDRLKSMVCQNNLEKTVNMVGSQENPYKFIKNATALVISSIHEAAPMVYGESATLGVPIITTETSSAIELVRERGIGIVVENSKDGIKDALKQTIDNKSILSGCVIPESDVNSFANRQFNDFIINVMS